MWLGKVIGGMLGFISGNPLAVFIGAVLGDRVDRGMDQWFGDASDKPLKIPPGEVYDAFFNALFVSLGKLAKSDGRVSEAEIRHTRLVMQRLGLTDPQKKDAIALFNLGKRNEANVEQVIENLRRKALNHNWLYHLFYEILMHNAVVDGFASQAKNHLLHDIASWVGLSAPQVERIQQRVRSGSRDRDRHQQLVERNTRLVKAYQLLGISKETTDAELKIAYRKLMSQHHPDKLVSQDLSSEQLEQAKAHAQDIRAAYDLVKSHRNLR